jgi:hypothetical protein
VRGETLPCPLLNIRRGHRVTTAARSLCSPQRYLSPPHVPS